MSKVIKNTALISVLTFASRVLGVVRDALIAMCFGTGSVSDVFFITFRPFDLIRKLFSEGVLSISFVPVFTDVLTKEGVNKAVSMFLSFFCLFSFFGLVIVFAGLALGPLVMKLIGPGFIGMPYKFDLAVLLLRIMLPYFWLVTMVALCMGVLNSLGNFLIPGIAPVVFNLVIISFTLFITNRFDVPVIGLAVGVTVGGAVQLAAQIPFMVRHGFFNLRFFKIIHPGFLRVVRIIIPCMVGAASYQINIMVASFFATKFSEGSVSFLYYADRLVQFPLALFAVSTATVFLPELSQKASKGNLDDIGPLFSKAVRIVFFITIPAMAGLMALNEEIVLLLFGHGKFDAISGARTGDCLFYLVTGLWAFTGTRLFVTLYFAVSSIRIPFFCGLVSIGLNLLCCFLLPETTQLKGLVLSVAFSSVVGFTGLFLNIPSSVNFNKIDIILSACRSVFFSAIMFFLVKKTAVILCSDGYGKAGSGIALGGVIIIGMIFYFGCNFLFSTPEFKMFQKGIVDKWK